MRNNVEFENLASDLHFRGSRLLETLPWMESMRNLGSIQPVGSYALNLMTWPDLDLVWELKEDVTPQHAYGKLFEALIPDPTWRRANMRNFSGDFKPHWPRGFYLGLEIDQADCGGIWKIDIWVQDVAVREETYRFLELIQRGLNPDTRNLILEWKYRLMDGSPRVPKMGSYWLYQAICLEGLRKKEQILRYLQAHGVEC